MSEKTNDKPIHAGRYAAIASVSAALLASSCCVVPLVLVTLGASGVWIGSLSSLDPYKGYFSAIALVFLAAGFWQAYKKQPVACEGDTLCAKPASRRITKTVLWVAAILILLSLSIDWWAPFFY